MVNYGSSLPADPATFEYRAKGRIIAMPMASAITVNNAEAYIAAARAGLGLIQVPAFDVRDLLKSGALAPVLEHLRPPSMPLSLHYAKGRNVPTRIAVFRDWVNDLLHREGVFDPVGGKTIQPRWGTGKARHGAEARPVSDPTRWRIRTARSPGSGAPIGTLRARSSPLAPSAMGSGRPARARGRRTSPDRTGRV